MRRFAPIFALLATTLLPRAAAAVQAPQRASAGPLSVTDRAAASGVLVAAPGTPALRHEVDVRYGAAPGSLARAWSTFVADTGDARWIALWDTATHRPVRIFGGSIPAPGTSSDAAAAEKHARDFLARHAGLLLAGRSVADFDLVANDDDAGQRTVAFQQMATAGSQRVPVLGGRVSLRYRADRLFLFGAEALPAGQLPAPQIGPSAAASAALDHLAIAQPGASIQDTALVALPLVHSRSFRVALAWRVATASASPESRTDVYVDARDGSVLATQENLRFLTGTLKYEAPLRGPHEHGLFPAIKAQVSIDDKMYSADASGEFSFDDGATSFACFPRSQQVSVVNADGEEASFTFDPAAAAEVVWSQKDDELGDAQLSGFIHASIAKEHAREVDPQLNFLNGTLKVHVNKNDPDYVCNAFFNGADINFFQSWQACNNTARLADVVYHEFGHAFHFHTILGSVGMYDPALGEGAADYFASIVTSDPYLAPGFYKSGQYLREFDSDRRWPQDISWDPHETGLIFAGAMWDLRTLLSEDLGPEAGPALAHQLYRAALRRAPNIPATYAEVLAADDDDGDLGNGTPHVCQILKAFVPHGLTPYLTESGLQMLHEPLRHLPAQKDPYEVRVGLGHAYPQCAQPDGVDAIELVWRTKTNTGTVVMTKEGDDYVAQLPGQAAGTQFKYLLRATAAGFPSRLPHNIADPEYKAFVGEVVPLYCTDFEDGAPDWVFGEEGGKTTDFGWGQPKGAGGDPAAAHSGESVIGTNLNTQGEYRKDRSSFATGPVVDLAGHKHVRLQFMRWLTVEDGYFDQAEVLVNGQLVWLNQGTDEDDGSLNHVDLEWRFEDIDLSGIVSGGATSVQVGFRLRSDSAAELGGWNVDDLCVVAWEPPPPPEPGAGGGEGGAGAGPGLDETTVACACRAAGGPAESGAPWVLLGLAAVLGRRARRRR